MVLVDRRYALMLERFEYSRTTAGDGEARVALGVTDARAIAQLVQLSVAGAHGSGLATAADCTLERRLAGPASPLVWRGSFALSADLLDDPRAAFSLQLGDREAMVLPAPLLRTTVAPCLTVHASARRSVAAARGVRMTALTAAIFGAGLPFAATASAHTTTSAERRSDWPTWSTPVTVAPTTKQAARGSSSSARQSSSTGASHTTRTTASAGAASSAGGSVSAGSTVSPSTCTAASGARVAPAQSGTASRTATSTPASTTCSASTQSHLRAHHHRLTGHTPADRHRHHRVTRRIAPATSGASPVDTQTAAERRRAAQRRAEHRALERHRAAERRKERLARRRAAAARRALLSSQAAARAKQRRHEHAVERRALRVHQRALVARERAAAARNAGSSTGGAVPSLPGFHAPASWTGIVTANPAFSATIGNLSGLRSNADRPPSFLIPIYIEAARRYHVPWQVLAAINAVETDYGSDLQTSTAGAIGWMQFEPGTWKEYGVAVDGVSEPNPYDPRDAIFAAARYLKANGGSQDIRQAIFAYNHAAWYVDEVMARAEAIAHRAQYARALVSRTGNVTVDFASDVEARPLIRYSGGTMSHYDRLIAAANMVSAADFAYRWGGGHEQPAEFQPFDCSGSVSYVMQQAGYRVPTTVSGDVGQWHLPSGPGQVTIFYNDVHTFMRIGNRYFGTSGFARPGGGAGWFDVDKLPVSYLSTFHEVHVTHLGADSFSANAEPTLDLAALRLAQREAEARTGIRAPEGMMTRLLAEARGGASLRQLAMREVLSWLISRGEQWLQRDLR